MKRLLWVSSEGGLLRGWVIVWDGEVIGVIKLVVREGRVM